MKYDLIWCKDIKVMYTLGYGYVNLMLTISIVDKFILKAFNLLQKNYKQLNPFLSIPMPFLSHLD